MSTLVDFLKDLSDKDLCLQNRGYRIDCRCDFKSRLDLSLLQDFNGKLSKDLTEDPSVLELLEDRQKAFSF